MNCTRAEQLIPLHAGGDLPTAEAGSLRQHIEACAHCRQMAEEFAASQAWLSEFAAPAFDESGFADLRASVRREIEQLESAGEGAAGRRWFGWLWPQWSPRLAFAAAALILLAGLAVVAYRVKPLSSEPTVAGSKQPAPPSPTPQHEEQQAVVNPPPSHRRPPKPAPILQRLTPDDATVAAVEPNATVLTAQNSTEPAINTSLAQAVPEMLRIEFQTADPNIRIIWFAPKAGKTESNTK